MTGEIPATDDLDDAKLLNLVRTGDAAAFAVLYQRHEQAARRLARDLVVSPAEIDDVVAETFAWVLDVARRGGGPTDAFRPYLLTAVRRVCHDRLQSQRRQVPTVHQEMADPGEPFFDTAMVSLDSSLITRAFLALPERWSAVLWHTEIEESSAAEVAPIFGLTANGVAALRRRAQEGLRQAYLQMHISRVTRQECKQTAERLGAFVRGALSKRDSSTVSEHLSGCDECQAVHAELADIKGVLRRVVAPIFLGSAAASYLATAAHSTDVAAGTAIAAGTATAAATATVAATAIAAGATGSPAASSGAMAAAAGASGGASATGPAAASGSAGSAAGAGAIGVGGFHGVAGASAVAAGVGAANAPASGAGLGGEGAGPGGDGEGARPAGGAGSGGGSSSSSSGVGAGSGHGGGASAKAGVSRVRHLPLLTRWLAGAAAAIVAVFAIAFAVTLTGNYAPAGPAHHPQAAPTPLPLTLSTPAQPQPSKSAKAAAKRAPATSPSAGQSAATSSSASSNPQPAVSSPPPSPTSSATAQLAASVGVYGGGYFGNLAQVAFQVSDTGSAATGALTVTITLPAGSSMIDGGRGHHHAASDPGDGWSCQPDSTGATCQHAGIQAGSQAQGTIFIMVSGTSACGQPVQLSATDGSASASAQSPEGIPCDQGNDG